MGYKKFLRWFWCASLSLMIVALISGCAKSVPPTTTTGSSTTTSATSKPSTSTTKPSATSTATTPKTSATTSAAPSTTASVPKTGGVLKIAFSYPARQSGYPPTSQVSGFYFAMPALEPLFRISLDGRLIPHLATGYELGPDLKSLTLTLRHGVKFHDGSDLNAEVIKYNLDMYKADKMVQLAYVTSIDVVDTYKVRLNLSQYSINLLLDLATSSAFTVASAEATKKNGKDWAKTHIVGTGPFKVKSFEPDVRLVYERFDGYWQKGKPYLDGIELNTITDAMTSAAALKANNVQVIRGAAALTPKNAYDLQSDFNVVTLLSQEIVLAPDSKNPDSPFSKKQVREALDYAIDRVAITKALGYGMWQPVDQITPKGFLGYGSDLARAYDKDKAKKLLADAGYGQGFKTTIISPSAMYNKDSVVAIQKNLADIGIQAEVDFADQGRYEKTRVEGWKNGLLVADIPVYANFVQSVYRWFEPRYIAYTSTLRPDGYLSGLDAALAAKDYDAQKKTAEQVMRAVSVDSMITPLWASPSYIAKSKNLKDDGFMTQAPSLWQPENAWLAK